MRSGILRKWMALRLLLDRRLLSAVLRLPERGARPDFYLSRRGIGQKITPAMAASVTSKLWEMSDMVKVLEAWENSGSRAL